MIQFPDRPPLPDPHPYVWVITGLYWELQETRRELRRARGLPPGPLCLVSGKCCAGNCCTCSRLCRCTCDGCWCG